VRNEKVVTKTIIVYEKVKLAAHDAFFAAGFFARSRACYAAGSHAGSPVLVWLQTL